MFAVGAEHFGKYSHEYLPWIMIKYDKTTWLHRYIHYIIHLFSDKIKYITAYIVIRHKKIRKSSQKARAVSLLTARIGIIL